MMTKDFYKQSLHAIKAAKAIIETRSDLYGGYHYSSRPSFLLIYDRIDLKEKTKKKGVEAAKDGEVTRWRKCGFHILGRNKTLQEYKRKICFMKAHIELKRESGTTKMITTMAATVLVVLVVLVMMMMNNSRSYNDSN